MARSTDRFASAVRPLMEMLEDRTLMSVAVKAASQPAAVTVKPAAATAFPLGGGLQEQKGSSLDHAFSDLVRTSDGFKNLKGAAAKTDAAGWPTEDFTVSVWDTAYTGVNVDVGKYNLSFTGSASTVVGVAGISAGKPAPKLTKIGPTSYTVDVPTGTARLVFKFTNTGGQVKNLKVLQPGVDPKNPQLFSPKYLALLQSLHPSALRLLDWNNINYGNTIADWTKWPQTTTIRQNVSGVAWAYSIQLANTVGSDLYLVLPAHVTDDFITKLATLVRDTLNPNLHVYLEYSNEVWNTAFEQGKYNIAVTQAEVKANPKSNLRYDGTNNLYAEADRRYARRLKEAVDIFRNVYKQKGPDPIVSGKVRAILSSQVVNLGRYDDMLKYVSKVFGAPNKWFYAIGVAPYFSLNKYRDILNYSTGQWTAPNTHLTVDQVLEGMGLSVASYESGKFATMKSHATAYGLKLIAYEAGIDSQGPFNIAAKKAAELDPRFKTIVTRYLNAWYKQGGDLVNWFTLGSRAYDSQSGTWGITNDRGSLNTPKEQVFRTFRGYAPTV